MIRRTYHCPECNHRMEVELSADQWDAPPPSCESCDARDMNQEFAVPAIGGSVASRAARITESIIAHDYGVANYTADNREGGVGKVSYATPPSGVGSSQWAGNMLQEAISIGKKTRLEGGGSGLDILQRNLRSGAQPDLIQLSKERSIKVW